MDELYIVYTGLIDPVMEVELENLLVSHGWISKAIFFGSDGERQLCFDKEEK